MDEKRTLITAIGCNQQGVLIWPDGQMRSLRNRWRNGQRSFAFHFRGKVYTFPILSKYKWEALAG